MMTGPISEYTGASGGLIGGLFGRSRQTREGRLKAGRIEPAVLINGRENVYEANPETTLAVFDGHVVLSPDCYTIDREARTLRLARRPVYDVAVLTA